MEDYRVEVLRDVPALAYAPLPQVERLAQLFDVRDYRDEDLCSEGGPPDRLFVLGEGQAEVIKAAGDDRRYKVATLLPGVLFGHVGVLTDQPRTASVRAIGKVRVLEMSASRARALLRGEDFEAASPFRRALIVALSRQLFSATATTMQLATDAGLTVEAATGDAREPARRPVPDDVEEQILRAQGQQV